MLVQFVLDWAVQTVSDQKGADVVCLSGFGSPGHGAQPFLGLHIQLDAGHQATAFEPHCKPELYSFLLNFLILSLWENGDCLEEQFV